MSSVFSDTFRTEIWKRRMSLKPRSDKIRDCGFYLNKTKSLTNEAILACFIISVAFCKGLVKTNWKSFVSPVQWVFFRMNFTLSLSSFYETSDGSNSDIMCPSGARTVATCKRISSFTRNSRHTIPWVGYWTGPSMIPPRCNNRVNIPWRSSTAKFNIGEYPVVQNASLNRSVHWMLVSLWKTRRRLVKTKLSLRHRILPISP